METVEIWVFGGQGQRGTLYGDLHVLTLSTQERQAGVNRTLQSPSENTSESCDLLLEDMHWSPVQWSMSNTTPMHDNNSNGESRPTPRAGHCCVMLQEQTMSSKDTGAKYGRCSSTHRNTHMLIFGGLAQIESRYGQSKTMYQQADYRQ